MGFVKNKTVVRCSRIMLTTYGHFITAYSMHGTRNFFFFWTGYYANGALPLFITAQPKATLAREMTSLHSLGASCFSPFLFPSITAGGGVLSQLRIAVLPTAFRTCEAAERQPWLILFRVLLLLTRAALLPCDAANAPDSASISTRRFDDDKDEYRSSYGQVPQVQGSNLFHSRDPWAYVNVIRFRMSKPQPRAYKFLKTSYARIIRKMKFQWIRMLPVSSARASVQWHS